MFALGAVVCLGVTRLATLSRSKRTVFGGQTVLWAFPACLVVGALCVHLGTLYGRHMATGACFEDPANQAEHVVEVLRDVQREIGRYVSRREVPGP